MVMPPSTSAQRMNHRAPKPSGQAANRGGRAPAATNRAPAQTRPTAPANRARPSGAINGGAVKSSDRYQNVDRSKINSDNLNKPKDRPQTADRASGGNRTNINTGDRNINTGDRNINTGDRNINIDNSRNVNVNVNRNVVVHSPYPYRRPPYTYGGFHFYCHFGYYYHPFTPYYWGPAWHPWGFFLATLTATAIVVSVNNQKYHYDQGVFYEESNGGYTTIEAPNGAVVPEIPPGAEQVTIEQNVTNNYYYGGTYYEKSDEGYEVVPPTAGSLVTNLPEGAEEVRIGDVTYVKYGDTYYQPVQVEGEDKYEVAQIESVE